MIYLPRIAFSIVTKRNNYLYIYNFNDTLVNEFELRMRLAALRQYLRDSQDSMTPHQIDEVLDLIAKLLQVLNELDKRR
ncbi:hypothetical protein DYBT9623_00359 [Dyadobacter sp. CECT 9623]|uniref:Four helix bundle protein n=1 Tax=Dyadobacter linearis TaxID=2823330 RepID=A0ABM8UJQ3_9BACT|nr:hypothetical protein [Dyadobacter sp. CECT 9623]CAG5067638.1 hypothetical protein DYBT9623_00359 [Dyadobacter sp. CECT 9623]